MKRQFKKHYYNNGIIQIKAETCPEGFKKGMLPRSPEHLQKIVNARRKNNSYVAWNKGKKGAQIAWNKGKKLTQEHIDHIQETKKRKHPDGLPAWNKGKKNPYGDQVNRKISETLKAKYKSGEIISKTLGKKASPETLKKLRNSHLGKHLSPEKRNKANEKRYITRKKHNSFIHSSYENEYYLELLNKFKEEDIIREYKETRYPFKCDFYIKSKDLFIELNFYPTHGNHSFNSSNEEDVSELNRLLTLPQTRVSSNGKILKSWAATKIYVWTEYDVLKKEIALKNNLNYKVYYSKNEAFDDINNL